MALLFLVFVMFSSLIVMNMLALVQQVLPNSAACFQAVRCFSNANCLLAPKTTMAEAAPTSEAL